MKLLESWRRRSWFYLRTAAEWLLLAAIVGVLCGFVGSAFHIGVHLVTEFRGEHGWALYCMPLLGLLIVGLYHLMKVEGVGTNDILEQVHNGKKLPIFLVPAIFIGTVLTHLGGGSSGREGAALQMGGTIGYHTGLLLHLNERDQRIATLAGMSAFFTALFGTPLAATVFSIAVVSVGVMYHAAFIPCLAASLVAYGVSLLCGVEPTRFAVTAPALAPGMLVRVALLSLLCALVSILFCDVMHLAEHELKHRLPNPWIRVVVGGVAIVALTLLCGTSDYNGAGMDVIARAVEQGAARPEAFLLKLLFTAITLGAGFRGGEVVPAFCVGATFGCVAGSLLGIPAGFAAAVGMIAVFCGATNCPLPSVFLAVEMFGDAGMLYYALACGISYIFSGYKGLYSSQTILYSKLTASFINVHTNAHGTGEDNENL